MGGDLGEPGEDHLHQTNPCPGGGREGGGE